MPDNASPAPAPARPPTPSAGSPTIRFRALGAVDLQRAGRGELRALLVQPKRLALFAYLALARPTRLHRRDALLALFWPEATGEQARRSLRQALHFIRHTLGAAAIAARGDEEVGVDLAVVSCDVHDFERAIDDGRPEEAMTLYRGVLLEGFHVSGVAAELEQWLDGERARLHARAVQAASRLADRAEQEGNATLSVQRLRDLLRLEPGSEAVLRRLMGRLDRAGDRAGALRAYDEFARRLADEVGAEPSRATTAVAERIRLGRSTGATAMVEMPPARLARGASSPSPLATPAAPASPARSARTTWIGWRAALAALVVVALGAGALATWRRGHESRATVAVAEPTPAARRVFDEAQRAASLGDLLGALRLFEAALAEDSSYALAAFWAARIASLVDGSRQLPLLAQAVRASRTAPPRDRLAIAAAWAFATNDSSALTLADSLVRLDPDDKDARLARGEALLFAGEYARALVDLNAVVALDTVVASRPADPVDKPCHACWAINDLTFVYGALDSLPAQERVLQAWARMRPRSHVPWAALGAAYATRGREHDAEAAWAHWRRLAPVTAELRLPRAVLALRLGRFEEADRALANLARDGGEAIRTEALWWQVISLRMQGRMDDALRTALRLRSESPSNLVMILVLAQVRLERGEYEQAARLFRTQRDLSATEWRTGLPAGAPDSAPGAMARAVLWPLVHEAAAYAALDDAARLAVLTDSVRRLGERELHGRDRKLHHHVRGLLLVAQRRDEDAVPQFQRAIVSPTVGYTRTNLELGRALLRLGRAREAVAALAPALRGGLEGSNLYLTHTELHEALAEAWDAAGNADSARLHWRWVADAWANGDAPFRARARRAREKAAGAP